MKDLILSRDERRTERAPVTECGLECDHVQLGTEERCAVVGQVRGSRNRRLLWGHKSVSCGRAHRAVCFP